MAAAPPPPPPLRDSPAAIPYELIEEILLRLPPDEPACLLRASLVCKAWGCAIYHRSFRCRLHNLHRTHPVLGFLHSWNNERIRHFVPTTASSFSLAAPDWRSWRALDCRHGRALFLSKGYGAQELLWEPITDARQSVLVPATFRSDWPSTAAVFCAVDGCDHRYCLSGPFRVVFVFVVEGDTDNEEKYITSKCVYSSESDTWGKLVSMESLLLKRSLRR